MNIKILYIIYLKVVYIIFYRTVALLQSGVSNSRIKTSIKKRTKMERLKIEIKK